MATKKNTEGVGKKIVEALKKQSAPIIEEAKKEIIQNEQELYLQPEVSVAEDNFMTDTSFDEIFTEETNPQMMVQDSEPEADNISFTSNNFSMPEPEQPQYYQQSAPVFNQDTELYTENVKVLGNLINQLPAGISKQTGAQIIKQTMEALGISMKTVLGEAQQIQEKLSMSTNESLNSIQEYKRQIQMLEKQVQQYHKQYNSLNDLISLFVQTGI